MDLPKTFKGEKYIYLLMGYQLALTTNGRASIGVDTGFTGGQNYQRTFVIVKYQDKTLLQEIKTSKSFADFSKYYEVIGELPKPIIKEFWENNENASKNWQH